MATLEPPRKIVLDTPEWFELLYTLFQRNDVRKVIMNLNTTGETASRAVSNILEELRVELDPLERMRLEGELVHHFFPQGVPWAPTSGSVGEIH